MNQTGRETAGEIEDEIPDVTEPVFNVISKDVKEPHVHQDVKEPSMKKHGGEKRKILLERGEVNCHFRIGVSGGHDSIQIKNFIQMRSLKQLPQEGEGVQHDDEDVYSRKVL